MPATDVGWSLNHHVPPIFQVYGTKRKNQEDITSHDEMPHAMLPKRQCKGSIDPEDSMETQQHKDPLPNACPETVLETHNTHHIYSENNPTNSHQLDLRTLQEVGPNTPGPFGDHSNRHCDMAEVNNNNQPTQLSFSQDEMIMDLNDEVYSNTVMNLNPTTDAEYEAACNMVAAMEGEGAPNPQQYGLQYCDSYCLGGDHSPTSGKVRCQCRPSWESMNSTRPYVSDYY